MFELFAHAPALIAAAGDSTVLAAASNGSSGLVKALQNFVGPIFLFAIGMVAMTFLVQRQVMQFLQFIALAIGIAVLFYFPEVIKSMAMFFSNAF
jgi:hypothetical protein